MKQCPKCKKIYDDSVLTCPECQETTVPVEDKTKKKKTIRFLDFFSEIFKKHSREEKEKLFICGTKETTPELRDIHAESVHPWIYSRVFAMFFIAMTILAICVFAFSNSNALPGFILLSSFMVPITCMFLFFELNVLRNISFAKMIKYLLVGGCASLLVAVIFYLFVNYNEIDYGIACLISLIEEVSKMLIVAFIIFRLKTKYRLNGLLIGAIVGAGFAAFESAGYAFNAYQTNGLQSMILVTVLRAILAPGGHVAWASICGYGIEAAIEKKGFSPMVLLSPSFWICFVIPFVLHAIWDMPFDFYFLKEIALIIISWIIILILIRKGFKQIRDEQNKLADVPSDVKEVVI